MSTKQVLKQEPPQYKIVEVERNWNFEVKCNACDETAYFNAGVYNVKTGKRILLAEKYFPNTGMIPKLHWGCMLNGVKNYVRDGKVIILNDMTRKLLYKPLLPYEKKQITLGRHFYKQLFYSDEFYRSRHIESKI